jgi:hypothetical protein
MIWFASAGTINHSAAQSPAERPAGLRLAETAAREKLLDQPAIERAMTGQTTVNNAGRFEALDAIRGICAMLVVLFHIPVYHALKGSQTFANLQFCVDMFFALSGFVLCHAYGNRLAGHADGFRFVVTRFARLWPLHMVMLVLFVGIEIVKLVFLRADGSFARIRDHSARDVRPGRPSPTSFSCSPSTCIPT